jgi:hypothetical protein
MARSAREDSQVLSYFNRARQHYHLIHTPDDDSFLQFLGCSKFLKKKWYETGIRTIYYRFLDVLDQLKKVTEDRDRLEKQLKELLGGPPNASS